MFWNKKQKQTNNYKNIIGLTNHGELVFTNSCNFLLPISKAFLCFFITVSSICGYASCFNAEFNPYLVIGLLFVFSFIIAYVRNLRNALLKNLFYLSFLIVYIYTIFKFYRYVNSGYHALVNITYAALENYLDIPALVHYEEIIENSYITISVFLLFLGIFELLLYHMWIGEGIRIFSVFALCFIPYAIPLFLRFKPDNFYIVLLLASSISVIFLYCSRHVYKKPSKDIGFSAYRHLNPWSYKTQGFSYSVNGLIYFLTIVISTLLSVCIFLIVSVSMPYSTFSRNERDGFLKENVKDEVEYFVTFGFSGLFNKYYATGGLSEGRLGGIYSVRPDYEDDLLVTYEPVSSDPVYLRGFVGVGYTDRQWLSTGSLYSEKFISTDVYDKLTTDTELYYEKSILSSKYDAPLSMKIKNVGALHNYTYLPYYGYSNDFEFVINSAYTGLYYPYTPVKITSKSKKLDENYLTPYLQVPEDTREEILSFLVKEDLLTEYVTLNGLYSHLSGDQLNNILTILSNEFTNNFTYSLNPGITPKQSDFVGHFLNKNHKGFCSHFATSAALILRTLGIPARYVEGYVITYDGSVNFDLNDDSDVLTAHVNDSKAHAWVEYYDPDFGWRVFEATTASIEPDLPTSDFWSNMFRLITSGNNSDNSDVILDNVDFPTNSITNILYKFFVVVLIIFVFIAALYYIYKFTKQYRSYHRNRNSINVRNYYKIICRKICRKYPEFDYIISTNKQLEFISTHYRLSKKINHVSIDKLAILLEQAQFSNKQLTDIECRFSMQILKLIRRNITFHI